MTGQLPPIPYPSAGYARTRAQLLERLRDSAALSRLQIENEADWIVALCDAWAALTSVFDFYQERILNEAFLSTCVQDATRARIYHSLGHEFPPNVTATTVLAYHLSDAAEGVEAVQRARRAGTGTGADELARQLGAPSSNPPQRTLDPIDAIVAAAAPAGAPARVARPPAPTDPLAIGLQSSVAPVAQVRSIAPPDGGPSTFVTTAALTAYVGASKLAAAHRRIASPPALRDSTTQLELAGTTTHLAVGQPVMIVAYESASDAELRWIRILTSVRSDSRRGSTRIGWEAPLSDVGGPPAAGTRDPTVYGFTTSSPLVGADTPAWSSLTLAQKLQARADDGTPVPTKGGCARSSDGGQTWRAASGGLPADVPITAVAAFAGDIVIAGVGPAGLLRSVGGGPFTAPQISGVRPSVQFVGGSASRMLAGGSNGSVLTSIDGGRNWSAISGGEARYETRKLPPTTATLVRRQIPAVTVRCAIEHAGFVFAGTDAGLYRHDGAGWTADKGLTHAIFALLKVDGTLYAATTTGVWVKPDPDGAPATKAGAAASAWTNVLPGGAYALARITAGDVFAGTDAGVWRCHDGAWSSDWLSGPVTSLAATTSGLLAGGKDGVFSVNGSLTSRCDTTWAFRLDAGAPSLQAGETVPTSLLEAFAAHGIGLDATTTLEEPSSGRWRLASARPPIFELTLDSAAAWHAWLVDAMPGVTALAAWGDDAIVAAGLPEPVAGDWPGMAVGGQAAELASALPGIASATKAVIEQRTRAQLTAQALDVTDVRIQSVTRFGRQTRVSRVEFKESLPPRAFPRRSSTVWANGTPLALFARPAGLVDAVHGSTITLAAGPAARLEPGRLATVSGAPLALTAAPLGGAWRTTAGRLVPLGPAQADVSDVVFDSLGNALLATPEGVFEIARQDDPDTDEEPLLLADHWTAGAVRALAVARAGAHAALLAATRQGVQRSVTVSGARGPWQAIGPSGTGTGQPLDIDSVKCAGARAVACSAEGRVYVCADALAGSPSWTVLPPVPGGGATQVALFGTSKTYAASPTGVFEHAIDAAGWSAMHPNRAMPAVTCLAVDGHATLWAGSADGLHRLGDQASTPVPDPGVLGSVSAIALDATGALVVAGEGGVLRHATRWQSIAATAGLLITSVASAPDGLIWVGVEAALQLSGSHGAGTVGLRHHRSFEVAVDTDDLETLNQSGVPPVVLNALTARGRKLDSALEVIALDPGPRCWLIHSGGDLYVLAKRHDGTRHSVVGFHNQAALLARAVGHIDSGVETWQVEVDDTSASLSVPEGMVVRLAAGAHAPSRAETVRVMSVSPLDGGAVLVAGAPLTLELEEPLKGVYDAATLTVNLNVVPAVQGDPISVPIGSGDPGAAHQVFATPTPVAAIGATAHDPAREPASSLRVFVDDEPWTPVRTLKGAAPAARVYAVRANPDGTMVVQFGDGREGSRLPAGRGNVVAAYLQGGGPAGEAAPGAVIQAVDRPQLVAAVHNPIAALVPATAPARALRTAAVRTLDQLISLSDYQDMAGAQAGVASANAAVVGGPCGRAIVVTVEPAASAPLDLIERVARALGTTSAEGMPVRVSAAAAVPVQLEVELSTSLPSAARHAAAVLGGLSAPRPGEPLRASHVTATLAALPGVDGARIIAWGRAGRRLSIATRLPGAQATWRLMASAPRPAELLAIDPRMLDVRLAPGASESRG